MLALACLVLIEPYWNVNNLLINGDFQIWQVLIEPYWNVNQAMTVFLSPS